MPVVALTSSALEQDRVDAYSLGVNSYWVKPTDFTVFLDEMTVLTTYWLALNVSPPAFRARPALATGRFAAEGPILTPRRQIPLPAIVVDADSEDLRRTIEALASLAVPARPLVGFEAVVDFLKGSGGPPPLLDPAFPRLFLVEVELDFGDGRDVLQALRYRTDHHAMVIMFTRRTDPAFVSECYRVKVSGVVRKPDDPAEYRAAVRLLASYWMLLNEPPPDPIWSKRAIAHPG
jgi:DNA-binding NarL/FixJ family response regulator